NKFAGLEHHRWTLDEPEDLEFLSKIFDMLMPKNIFFDHQDILNLLNEYPMLLKINNGIIRNQGLIDSLKNEK
ncbi:MAG TPA: spore coat protein, partial [Methylophilaceae bacterium]|nr:spore coat protein [Methylophilaceae bacterium]